MVPFSVSCDDSESKYPLFSTSFILVFHEALSDRLFLIAKTPLAMGLYPGALYLLLKLEIGTTLGSRSRRSDKMVLSHALMVPNKRLD